MVRYTEQEDRELNKELKKLKMKASRLILNEYYDYVRLNEIQYSALTRITNALTHNDINYYLWNSGILEKTLDYIASEIKRAKRSKH